MKILCLIFILLIGVAIIKAQCPPKELGRNCECTHGVFYEGNGTKVECWFINSTEGIKEIQRFRGYHIDFLKLKQIQLPFFPAGLFSGMSVKRLYLEDSNLDNLYSVQNYKPSPFDGLEDSLEEVYITSTQDPSKWYWPEVRNLKKLKRFEIVLSPIDFVGHEFAEIGGGSLESITVAYSRVYRIHPQAFPELINLREANFAGNYLPYLVRTMFANPAPRLEKLDFRNNKLFTLPEDMFENMPALKYLDLSANEFRNFENIVFDPIWSQLQSFYISDNPFKCGCSLLPLKQKLISGSSPQRNDLGDVKCINHGDNKKTLLKNLDENYLQCS
ncbi:leucine-rich repeat-containing protein 15-like isoform X2 [Argiope bruennichi]|nr:leucine-rich repeat-containing protein 15-like isoform X2 [Argiope bruennichi]KAF8790330.1 Leucine-rich repeat-containing protein 70 [Argiope bruennichi]